MALENENIRLTLDDILNRIKSLENDVHKINKKLNLNISEERIENNESVSSIFKNKTDKLPEKEKEELSLENKFGQYGLVWVGNIVLIFGLIFISQYFVIQGFNFAASLVGFISVFVMLGLSIYIRKSLAYIALMFRITSVLLLYYFSVRLHFFTDDPLISSKWICLTILLCLNAGQYYLSVKLKSKMFGVIALFLTISTAIFSNHTHLMLLILTLTSIISMYSVFKYNWRALLILSVILVYSAFILWLSNNPIMSGKFVIVEHHQHSIIYLFIIASVYTLLSLLPNNKHFTVDFILGGVLLNGIAFSLMLLLYVLSFYPENYVWIFLTVFLLCLIASVTLKFKSRWNFAAPFYAIYGFLMLSIAVFGYYGFPNAFFILAVESLFVVSMALWFRSKFIVIMNGILFILLLITYMSLENKSEGVNFAFAITALITARILNWKRKQLDIKTDMLRNSYLIGAFIMMCFALYKSVPEQFITISWTATAGIYFVFSRVLNNVKYRWMAIFMFFATAFYLFFVDLDKISIIYRIIAFMALAIISIIISVIYARKSNIKPEN